MMYHYFIRHRGRQALSFLLLAGMLLSFASCSRAGEDDERLDEQIPGMLESTVESTIVETDPDLVDAVISPEEPGADSSDAALETAAPARASVSYEDSYAGCLQRVYDVLYSIEEEIAYFRGTPQDQDVYDLFSEKIAAILDGQSMLNDVSTENYKKRGFLSAGVMSGALQTLFSQYPEESVRNEALVDFASFLCFYEERYVDQTSGSWLLDCDAFYNCVFPSEDMLEVEVHETSAFFSFKGFDGGVRVEKQSDTYYGVGTARLEDFRGKVRVAPENRYGAHGRFSDVVVKTEKADDGTGLLRKIEINGEANPGDGPEQHEQELLSDLSALKILDIRACALTSAQADEILSRLPHKERLEYLCMEWNALSGTLDLSEYTSIRGIMLERNTELTALTLPADRLYMEYLYLNETGITDLGFLRDVREISMLWLNGTGISDISILKEKNIHVLYLGDKVTDFSVLPQIQFLDNLSIDTETPLEELMPYLKACRNLISFTYNGEPINI